MRHCLVFPLFLSATVFAMAAEVRSVVAAEAAKLVAGGTAVLVDVREPGEWAETGVAAPAALLPMSDFNGSQQLWKPFLRKNAGREIILYCRSGNRAAKVATQLAARGMAVANAGGFRDWISAGLPVRKPGAPAASPAGAGQSGVR